MIFTDPPTLSEDFFTDKNKASYIVVNKENFTTTYTATPIKKYNSINCGITFKHRCCPDSKKSPLLILIPDIHFLKNFSDFIKKHLSKNYHIVLIQTYMEILHCKNLLIYNRYIRLCSDPFSNISVYCDKLIDYNLSEDTPKTKTIIKRALISLKHHLEDVGFEYIFITGLKSNSRKSTIITSDIKFLKLDILPQYLENQSQSYLNNYLETARQEKSEKKKIKKENKIAKITGTKKQSLESYEEYLSLIEFSSIPEEKRCIGMFTKQKNSNTALIESISKSSNISTTVSGKLNCNRAINNDIVGVSLSPNKKDNKVVCIIKRAKTSFFGILAPTDKISGSALFLPSNKAYPPISIQSSNLLNLKNKIISVNLDNWPINREFPVGHLSEIIGESGDLESETNALLKAAGFDISHKQFPKALLNSLKDSIPVSGKILDENYVLESLKSGRRDFRDRQVISVDPEGCVDIDDAIHVKKLGEDYYEIGVHIADVTAYVEENSELDRIASERGTSVYLVQKRIDMLPDILSSNVCSLHENVDRLSFSILWECKFPSNKNTKENGPILNTIYFGKSLIRSRRAFSYEEALNVIENKPTKKEDLAFKKGLQVLLKLSEGLRKKRIKNGAMILSKVEPKFRIDRRTMEPLENEIYSTGKTNSMIEELMVLANTTAAEIIIKHFPENGILRKHPEITETRFEELKDIVTEFSNKVKVKTKLETQKDITKVFQELNDKGLDAYGSSVLSQQFSRRMNRAYYFCAGDESFKGHFGLALNLYTHFTSPIRRYADILVHRMLNFDANKNKHIFDTERIRKIIDNVNERYLKGKRVGMKSVELYAKKCLSNLKGKVFEVFISKVWEGGVEVYVIDLAFSFTIFLNTGEGETWKFDGKNKLRRNEGWKDCEVENVSKEINSIGLFNKFESKVVEIDFVKKDGTVIKKEVLKIIKSK